MKVKTTCTYCGEKITVKIPLKILLNNGVPKGLSCNKCVPANSATRDGINESIYTEVESPFYEAEKTSLILAGIFFLISLMGLNKYAIVGSIICFLVAIGMAMFAMVSQSYIEPTENKKISILPILVFAGFGIIMAIAKIILA